MEPGRGRPSRTGASPAGEDRDRVVDAARAASVLVVVVWHWTLSVTHRDGEGRLVMPNPVDVVPGGWLATWLLQVMPVFFLVGGYATAAAWESGRRRGVGAAGFVAGRLRRLLLPLLAWAACWLAVELVAAALPGPHRWVWQEFPGYLAPLWFLAVYTALTAAVPVTVRLHERFGGWVPVALAAGVAVGSVAHRAGDSPLAGWVTAALVWLLVFQLGFCWRSRLRHLRPAAGLLLAAAGLAGLALLSGPGGYPRSLVATAVERESNMLPTSAMVAALAVLQLGLLVAAAPAVRRLLARRGPSRLVAAANGVALSVFLWHMTAYLAAVLGYEAAGGTLGSVPDAAWWRQRWLWLLLPGAVLAVLLPVAARVESAARSPRGRSAARGGGRRPA